MLSPRATPRPEPKSALPRLVPKIPCIPFWSTSTDFFISKPPQRLCLFPAELAGERCFWCVWSPVAEVKPASIFLLLYYCFSTTSVPRSRDRALSGVLSGPLFVFLLVFLLSFCCPVYPNFQFTPSFLFIPALLSSAIWHVLESIPSKYICPPCDRGWIRGGMIHVRQSARPQYCGRPLIKKVV